DAAVVRGQDQAIRQQATLERKGNRAAVERWVGTGTGHHAVGHADVAEAVRPDDTDAGPAREVADGSLPLGAGLVLLLLGEPAGDDVDRADTRALARLQNARDQPAGDDHHRQVDTAGDRLQRRVARQPEDLVVVRVDRVDLALEAAVDQAPLDVVGETPLWRRADDCDAPRVQERTHRAREGRIVLLLVETAVRPHT